ncbi:MAG: alpha/beta hydrolase [Lysinibacillus sp.]|nr:alpha/beta hydrolase [Lysinibacillus sp.]
MSYLLQSSIQYLKIINYKAPLYTTKPKEERVNREKALKNRAIHRTNFVHIEDRFIPVRDGSSVKVRIYTPKKGGPFPVIVYYHGGGWVLNSVETCDISCELLAQKTNAIVVSVDYRLAPEYKFPVPLNDAYDAFLWTVNNLNGKTNEIFVAGDSAGGNLATVVTIMNRDLKGPTIKGQILLYPVTDLTFTTPSYEEFAVGYGLLKKDMEWFSEHYLNNESEKLHPYVSPMKEKDLTNLPAAYIVVCENDVLRDEGIAYAKRLEYNGVKVEWEIARGLVHSYFTKNEVFHKQIDETIDKIKRFLFTHITENK